jgi:hypothetical protein
MDIYICIYIYMLNKILYVHIYIYILNKILQNHVNVNYDKPKYICVFKRTSIITNDKHKFYLNIINAEDFLGFSKNKRNTLIELPLLTDVFNDQPINVIGDEAITI